MASITTGKDGLRRIQFVDVRGTRRTVALGRMPKRQAEVVKRHVEALVVSQISQCSVEQETARWLESLDGKLRSSLAKTGLISDRENVTLAEFVPAYISGRSDVKESSIGVLRRTESHMLRFFDGKRLLRSFTTGDAKDFRSHLLSIGLAEATVRRTCANARQIFGEALERGLVSSNAFKAKGVPTTPGANADRQAYISREQIAAVLEACPNARWRLLVGLSRFAGLRVPSETSLLRWCDVNWERNRITVRSPKTEHHEGKAFRVIPIFKELRPLLEEAFDAYGHLTEFVVACDAPRTTRKETSTELWRTLKQIVLKAGEAPWPRLWHNLRASCQTDLARVHPLKAVCEWLGNSPDIATRHYLQTTEEDFENAIGEVTQNPTLPPAASDCQPMPAPSAMCGESRLSSDLPSDHVGMEDLRQSGGGWNRPVRLTNWRTGLYEGRASLSLKEWRPSERGPDDHISIPSHSPWPRYELAALSPKDSRHRQVSVSAESQAIFQDVAKSPHPLSGGTVFGQMSSSLRVVNLRRSMIGSG
jgi:integrase